MVYRFAAFQVDPSAKVFLRQGASVSLTIPGFVVLQALLEHPGSVVARQTLLQQIESAAGPGDSQRLDEALAELERALAEPGGNRWIETTPEGGVRFSGSVTTEATDSAVADIPANTLPAEFGNDLFRLQSQPKRRSHVQWVVALLLLTSLAPVLYLSHRSRPEPLPVILATRQLTLDGHDKLALALSPDSKTAWYTDQEGRQQLWQLNLVEAKSSPLPSGPLNQVIQAVSRNGKRLLVCRTGSAGPRMEQAAGPTDGLWQIDVDGGNARLLVAHGWWGAWSPDGRRMAYSRMGDHGVYVANADGSHAHSIARLPGYPWYLSWTPEGDRLLMSSIATLTPVSRFPEGPLYRVFVAGGRSRLLDDDTGNPVEGSQPVVAPDHRHILFTHTAGSVANVWEVDRQTGHLLAVTSNQINTRLMAVGPGPNQILTAREALHARLFQLPNQGHRLEPFPAGIETRDMAFSPDGKWIAFVDLEGSLWQARVDGSHPVRLLTAKWKASEPAWDPDSRQLIVSAAPQGGLPKLYRLSATEKGADDSANAITSGMGTDRDATWAPDRRHVLFCRTISGVSELKWLNLDSGSLQGVSDSRGKCSPQMSSHGFLSATDDTGQTLFIRRGLEGGWERIPTGGRGIGFSAWSRDGGSLFFLAGSTLGHVAGNAHGQWKRYDLHAGKVTTLADLGPVSNWFTGPWHWLALTASDGLVISFDISGSEINLVTVGNDQ